MIIVPSHPNFTQNLYKLYLTKNYTFKAGMKEVFLEELMKLFAIINQERLANGYERYIEFEIAEDGGCYFCDTMSMIYPNPTKKLGAKRLVDIYAEYKLNSNFVYD